MKLKTYKIVSSHDSVPLAQIRTDGQVVEFIVDNTNGSLPSQLKSMDERKSTMMPNLQKIVSGAYHLKLEEDDSFVPQVMRYILENGDVAEITTDGLTAALNGELLTDDEKRALFDAIKRGEIKVAKDENTNGQPVPAGTPAMPIKPSAPEKKPLVSREFIQGLAKVHEEQAKQKSKASANHDPDIENMEFSDEVADKGFAKNLAYILKYGKPKGGNNG